MLCDRCKKERATGRWRTRKTTFGEIAETYQQGGVVFVITFKEGTHVCRRCVYEIMAGKPVSAPKAE